MLLYLLLFCHILPFGSSIEEQLLPDDSFQPLLPLVTDTVIGRLIRQRSANRIATTRRLFPMNYATRCDETADKMAIGNGTIASSGSNFIGSRRPIYCNQGFYLFGNDTSAICGFNGKWTHNSKCLPTCNDPQGRCVIEIDKDLSLVRSGSDEEEEEEGFWTTRFRIALILSGIGLIAGLIVTLCM